MQTQTMSTTTTQPGGPAHRHCWGWVALLIVITLTAYLPAVGNGYIWDDDAYLTNNKLLDSGKDLWHIWRYWGSVPDYYPLTFTTFWLEKRLWGLDPLGYHVNNVLLHALNAVLLWRLLAMLKVPGAWLAAAVFALHPVNVETVAWITQRKNVLSTAFYLASMIAFLHFYLPREAEAHPRKWWYVLSFLCYLLAMLSKTVAITMPMVLLVVLWWKRGRISMRSAALLAPFAIAAVHLCRAGMWTQHHIVRASGPEWDFSFLERCLIAGRVLWSYAYTVAWPAELVFIYPRWTIDTGAWWQYLFPAGAVAVPVSFWLLRHRIGRGPLAAALCFGLTLGPASGFFNVYWQRFSFVADHVLYVAAIAMMTLATTAAHRLVARWGGAFRLPVILATALLLMALGTLTWRQLPAYRHEETLWRHTLKHNPQAWIAHNNLGRYLEKAGRTDEAIDQYRKGLENKPDHAKMHNNLAIALQNRGEIDEATRQYRLAVHHDPRFVAAFFNLGNVLMLHHKYDQAIEQYRLALRLTPRNAVIHDQMAIALRSAGLIEKAIDHHRMAIQIDPRTAQMHFNLGMALAQAERHDESIQALRRAITLKPDYARSHFRLALVLKKTGRTRDAIHHLRRTTQLNPNRWEPFHIQAWILATDPRADVRDAEQAIPLAYHAVALTGGGNAKTLDTLAAALAVTGQYDNAVAAATKAYNLAKSKGNHALTDQISRRLDLYRKGQPYRQSDHQR